MDNNERRDFLTGLQASYSREIRAAVQTGERVGLLFAFITLVWELASYRLLPQDSARYVIRLALKRYYPARLQHFQDLFGQDRTTTAQVIGPFDVASYREARSGEDVELSPLCDRVAMMARLMRDEGVGPVRARSWCCNGRRDPETGGWLIEPCQRLLSDMAHGTDTCPYYPTGMFLQDPQAAWSPEIEFSTDHDEPADWHVAERHEWIETAISYARSVQRDPRTNLEVFRDQGRWVQEDPLGRAVYAWAETMVDRAEIVVRHLRAREAERYRNLPWPAILIQQFQWRRRRDRNERGDGTTA